MRLQVNSSTLALLAGLLSAVISTKATGVWVSLNTHPDSIMRFLVKQSQAQLIRLVTLNAVHDHILSGGGSDSVKVPPLSTVALVLHRLAGECTAPFLCLRARGEDRLYPCLVWVVRNNLQQVVVQQQVDVPKQ